MAIRLRPHHLLCLLTFSGSGYSPRFTANFTGIVDRLMRGEPVALVAGPDDICAPLCDENGVGAHCFGESVALRDDVATAALTQIPAVAELFANPVGGRLGVEVVAKLREHFASGELRGACTGCEWFALCTEIAAANFTAARLAAQS